MASRTRRYRLIKDPRSTAYSFMEKTHPGTGMQIIGDGGAGRLRRFISVFEHFAELEKKVGNPSETPRKPLVVPEAGNFGEVGKNFSWQPTDALTGSEVRPHLKKAGVTTPKSVKKQ